MSKSDPVRAFLASKGIATDVLDRKAPSVDTVVQDRESLFDFVGDDAAALGADFRLSCVFKDSDVQRLRSEDFVAVADHRAGSTAQCDVYVRGVGRAGVVMARPKKLDAEYKRQRAQRDHERRVGRRSDRRQHGSGHGVGTLTTTTDYSPATVSGN